jgi:hypothetical protein
VRWLRDFGIVLALLWLLLIALTTAQAQEPTPPPEPPCTGIESDGGLTLVAGNVEITLPPGNYGRTIAPPTDLPRAFSICHEETGATVVISGANCEEVRREADSPEGHAVLDAILASCRLLPTPTPEPTLPFACPEGTPVSGELDVGDSVHITLPEGEFILTVDDGVANFCNAEEEYNLPIGLQTCTPANILPPGHPLLEIQGQVSCYLLHPPTGEPADPGVTIVPPHTGNAGLITRFKD